MAIKSMDTASRPDQVQWGTATGDPFGTETWALVRSSMTWNVTSNELTCNSSSGSFVIFILGSQTPGDAEILARVNPADTTSNTGIVFCYNSTTQFYYAVFINGTLVIGVAPSFSNVASVSFSYSASTWYYLRVRKTGANLYVKAWAYGTGEPTNWTTNGTDSTYSSGRYGLGTDSISATTTKFDGFVVTDATISVVSEAVSLAETVTLTGANSLSDSVQLSESTTQAGESDTTDAVVLSENTSQAGTVSLSDAVSLSENVTQAGSAQLSDQVSLSESIAQAGTISITDLVQLSEAVVQTGIASNTDTAQLSETVVLAALGILNLPADVVQISEAVTLLGVATLSDNVQLGENVTGIGAIILSAESAQLSETVSAMPSTPMAIPAMHITWITDNMVIGWRTED